MVSIALSRTKRQFTRFVIVGIATNLTLYVCYLLLTVVSLKPHAAMTITYGAGMAISFLLNRSWTFNDLGEKGSALSRYVLVYVSGYVFNYLMLSALVDTLGFPHQVAQACLIVFLAIAFFLAQKFWVFAAYKVE